MTEYTNTTMNELEYSTHIGNTQHINLNLLNMEIMIKMIYQTYQNTHENKIESNETICFNIIKILSSIYKNIEQIANINIKTTTYYIQSIIHKTIPTQLNNGRIKIKYNSHESPMYISINIGVNLNSLQRLFINDKQLRYSLAKEYLETFVSIFNERCKIIIRTNRPLHIPSIDHENIIIKLHNIQHIESENEIFSYTPFRQSERGLYPCNYQMIIKEQLPRYPILCAMKITERPLNESMLKLMSKSTCEIQNHQMLINCLRDVYTRHSKKRNKYFINSSK